jgi:threonine/homoserine/homoserine lactone efflux protein
MKKLCYGVLGVAAFMTLLFLLDLFLGFPFAGASITLDIFCILGGAVVSYLAWDTARDIR